MQSFRYKARHNTSGEMQEAEVKAESEQAAAKLLIGQGLIPVEIKPADASGKLSKLKGRIKAKDKILYSRQLATLINAGLPLTQSLRVVGDQINNQALQKINEDIIVAVEGGSTLADAFGKYPKAFNGIYVHLLAAGEASGTLDETLERIADQQEKDDAIMKKIRGAMIYPILVLSVIALVLIFLLTTVVPQIKQLYEDLGKDLPFISQVLVSSSDLMKNFWYFFIPLPIGLYFLLRWWGKTPDGKSVLDRVKMKVPLFGPLFMKLYMSRFSRTSATLLKAGVQMLESLRISSESINNVHIERSIVRAMQDVKGGGALSDALEGDTNFYPLVPQMIRIGEKSGALDDMLHKVANYYEDELDNQIKSISTIIEPVLMVVLGVVAGTVIAAILLPVYGLVGESLSL